MDDALILLFFLVLALFVVGSILGVVGFAKARRALTEVAALRATMAAWTTSPAAAPATAVVRPAAPVVPNLVPREIVEPALGAEPVPPAPERPGLSAEAEPGEPRVNIELLLTQRWGMWIGSVALLLAAVFLVRYAVAHAWIGPAGRCALAALLGCALIGGAWRMLQRPASALPLADYAPSALAAGGVGALFAAAYGAGPLYGLVSATAEMVLLAAAGVAGLALSLVFGWLVGAVGLAAAFVLPGLVQTDDPSLPGLFAYLLVVSAACWAVVRLRAWVWLGWAAAAGGTAWVALVAVHPPGTGLWAPGLFVPAAAALTLALLPGAALEHPVGRRFAWAPMLLLGLAGLTLVATTGDETVRVGLLLLAPVAVAKAWSEPRLAWLPMVSALLAVLTLLVWAIPEWQPTGEAITIEGAVQAVLPGAWAPNAIQPLLWTAALVALFHAAVGLLGERRTARPLPWAALAAGVPVIVLGVAYAQVGQFQTRPAWALTAGVLAVGLVVIAGLGRRATVLPLQRAGVHAAGAVAALALGYAIILEDAWLTVAIALMLPGLAWIEGAAGLPALRRVALVVAGVVLVRLVLNPSVAGYAFGATPVLNGLLVAYGIPAVCFGVASWMFRQRRDDGLVAVLEAGACAFLAVLLVLEVRQSARGAAFAADAPGFDELAWDVTGLGSVAVLLQWVARRFQRNVLEIAWQVIGVVALAGGAVLLAWNPLLVEGQLGEQALFNALVPAYLLPAGLALVALAGGRVPRLLMGGFALAATFMWVSVEVRQAFHPGATAIWESDVEDAELWALSAAWLVLALALLGAGVGMRERALRLAGLGMVVLVVAKVFLVDMSGLDGLWRVLSFLGLGLGLVGLGTFYRRFAARV